MFYLYFSYIVLLLIILSLFQHRAQGKGTFTNWRIIKGNGKLLCDMYVQGKLSIILVVQTSYGTYNKTHLMEY